ncbi:MAG: nuclear transport factor 2 family protein [Pseudomonadota bacterium]
MLKQRGEQMKDTAQQLFKVWSSGAIADAAPLITDDFLLCDHALNRRHQGLEAVIGFFAETDDIIGLDFELINIFVDEQVELVAGRWVLTATILKSGASVLAPGMSMLRFRENMVCEQNDHYSATDVIRLLFKSHPLRAFSMAKRDLFS